LAAADNRIFISIAAYRDPQLIPTVEDCIAKARYPDALRFGICWQHAPHEKLSLNRQDERFRVLDVDFRESKGACWARTEVMKLWRGEEWFLQVDSHCRFARDWDEKLLQFAKQTESPKPILTTYASPFTPGENEILQGSPLQMGFQGFTAEGIPYMKPLAIPQWQSRKTPMRARFLSAGFLFTRGKFVEEVGYDPELYFLGEEAALTLRAFTNGYDLFHPCETIVSHDYVRADATKHWDDHTYPNQPSRDWGELDLHSKDKVRRLLAGEPVDTCGLGSTRTLEEYERYAGISFRLRKVQDYTLRAEEPPNPEAPPDWAGAIYTWLVRITLDRASLPVGSFEDPSFWFVGIHDRDRNEIYRKDISPSELEAISADEAKISLICELQSGSIPSTWTVWPVSRSLGWLRKVEGSLTEDDYTILLDENPSVSSSDLI
jgi:Glycosyltransferase (GlcNAc)